MRAKGEPSSAPVKIGKSAFDRLVEYCDVTGLTKSAALTEAAEYFLDKVAPGRIAEFQKSK